MNTIAGETQSGEARAGAERNAGPAAQKLGRSRRRLGFITLVAALAICIGLPALVQTVNLIRVAGFPLGFYVAAQGAPLVVGMVLFLHARRANRLERAAGMARE